MDDAGHPIEEVLRLHRHGAIAQAVQGYQQIIKREPRNAEALYYLALAFFQQGHLTESENFLKRVLAIAPRSAPAHYLIGLVYNHRGELTQALASMEHAVECQPNSFELLTPYADILLQLKRYDDALANFDRALLIKADYVPALNGRGMALRRLNRFEDALKSCDRVLAISPRDITALRNRASILYHLRQFEDALKTSDAILEIEPDNVDTLSNRGAILHELRKFEDALASYDRALSIKHDYIDALNNRGTTLAALHRFEEALASHYKAIDIAPSSAVTLSKLGDALHMLRRLNEALTYYDRALAIDPNLIHALYNRGLTLYELDRHDEAIANFDRALAIKADYAAALNGRAMALRGLNRLDEAIVSYERTLSIEPGHRYALGGLASAILKACDFERVADIRDRLIRGVNDKSSIINPFTLFGLSDDLALQFRYARTYVEDRIASPPAILNGRKMLRHDKARIAYLSSDFHEHATAYLMAELFERHDRTRFDITGISFGPDDSSAMRRRLIKSFDRFHDVRQSSDCDVANLINELEIDIAVDLKGHTDHGRLDILAYRPSPIQVNYLGYPGTTGADFIDYIVADEIVLPLTDQEFYSEKIVHLPGSYQVNDSKRKISDRIPTRGDVGLPESGFVFCSFNNNYKITAAIFDLWMRLLGATENSVLWLLHDNDAAQRNLRRAAVACGIDPARLIFAPRLPLDEHLARHKLADLFLDTLPINAHTTASDALWAGLPVLTCRGKAFIGRVAASLLTAIGLPELVTDNLADYEALALRLARDASLLRRYRQRLEVNRTTSALFDAEQFRRHLEQAYLTMLDIYRRGEKPHNFRVASNGLVQGHCS